MVKIRTIGGFSEIGRNMTAVQYKDEVIICDMGVHLENFINFRSHDDDDERLFSVKDLIAADAVPDDSVIKDVRNKVIAIIPSHGHLDHIGAIPYLAQKYDCPILCTPYTSAVIKAILRDKKIELANEIIVLENDKKTKLSDSITIEFVNMTHSIPHTATVVIHTPDGQVVYANDFKLDDTPVIGQPPNYKRLEELGNKGNVKALIIDSLYSHVPGKTPSESVARDMLKDVMLNTKSKGKGMIVTTFSSQIARLKSIVEFGKKMNRKIVFLGRSLSKYVFAAEETGLVNFSNSVEIVSYRKKINKKLKQIDKIGREKYLIVATGHQGEPRAVMSRIAGNNLDYKLKPRDIIIFSCNVIPSPVNEANRNALERSIMQSNVQIFRDVHQSGHGRQEDHKKLISLLKPKHVIPAHAGPERTIHLANLAEKLGYKKNKTVHIMEDGQTLDL